MYGKKYEYGPVLRVLIICSAWSCKEQKIK